jgi:hypothetical protein
MPASLTLTTIGNDVALLYLTDDTGKNNHVTAGQMSMVDPITQETNTWLTVTDTAETMTCDIAGKEQIANGWKVPLGNIKTFKAEVREGDDLVNAQGLTAVNANLIGLDGIDTLIGSSSNDYVDGGAG